MSEWLSVSYKSMTLANKCWYMYYVLRSNASEFNRRADDVYECGMAMGKWMVVFFVIVDVESFRICMSLSCDCCSNEWIYDGMCMNVFVDADRWLKSVQCVVCAMCQGSTATHGSVWLCSIYYSIYFHLKFICRLVHTHTHELFNAFDMCYYACMHRASSATLSPHFSKLCALSFSQFPTPLPMHILANW